MRDYSIADFETEGIDFDSPIRKAPAPVGVALWEKARGQKPRYYAFGHPTNNGIYELAGRKKVKRLGPCSRDEAKRATAKVWNDKFAILFHHAPFDVDVAAQHFQIPVPAWDKILDTKYTLFFRDPHAPSLQLKPSAERWLGEPPEEKDALRDWLIEHKVIPKDASEGNVGGNICKCPGDLVARYAIGDLTRTAGLHDLLQPWVIENGMQEAYDRERRIMPVMLQNEYEGIRFDVERAEQDIVAYQAAMQKIEAWLCTRLKVPEGFNFNSKEPLAEALDRSGVVTEWTMTRGGKNRAPQRSTSKKVMTHERFKDKEVFRRLGYRNRCQTVLSLNLIPWTRMAQANGGRIFTTWNQVKTTSAAGDPKGARSGRLSCSRFQNISKDFYDKGDGYEHPKKIAIPELPLVRKYLLPDKGGVFCHRDYNQQEFRILAHFEDGEMLESYLKNPRLDYHNRMHDRVLEVTGEDYERRLIKNINFAINYGTGAATLAETAHITIELAKKLKYVGKKAAPGVIALDDDLKSMGRAGEPIRTWGGRLYYCEKPAYSERFKREMTWEYRLLNYLIQGSAADCTKEAMRRLFDHPKFPRHARFLVTVHDEFNVSAHSPEDVAPTMKIVQEVMESLGSYGKGAPGVAFDVPMLTDGKSGPSWGELKKYAEPESKGAQRRKQAVVRQAS
jgi:DNA polymerase I-like protein with 3'-5' exonuclease and polymerase domains